MKRPPLSFQNGATITQDRLYRYSLWRTWDLGDRRLMWIGLNPSVANENENDPTIRRVISFSKSFGYDGMVMCNLFGLVSPYPEDLLSTSDPQRDNESRLDYWASMCDDIVFCWGSFKEAAHRASQVIEKFPDAYCLAQNKDGMPRHPLYVPGSTQLKKYDYSKWRL